LGASISKQCQKFGFGIESLDIIDYMTKNKAFKYLLESRCKDESERKSCLNIQFKFDTANPQSDLGLILTNNCHLIFCINFNTIFTVATYMAEAIFKEQIETSYYRDFAKAAMNVIDQYVQIGIAFAVFLVFFLIIL